MIHSLEGWGTKQYWGVSVTILLLAEIPSTYPNRERNILNMIKQNSVNLIPAKLKSVSETWGFQSGDYEDHCLLCNNPVLCQ